MPNDVDDLFSYTKLLKVCLFLAIIITGIYLETHLPKIEPLNTKEMWNRIIRNPIRKGIITLSDITFSWNWL